MGILRAIIAAYIVATLAATSLAKLKGWRLASANLTRESVIPRSVTTVTLIVVALTEFTLSILLASNIQPILIGAATATLFLIFCAYQLLVAARTNFLMCSCSGTLRTDPASPPAIAGTVSACLIQAAMSISLVIIADRPGPAYYLLTTTAWLIPVGIFFINLIRRTETSELRARFWLIEARPENRT